MIKKSSLRPKELLDAMSQSMSIRDYIRTLEASLDKSECELDRERSARDEYQEEAQKLESKNERLRHEIARHAWNCPWCRDINNVGGESGGDEIPKRSGHPEPSQDGVVALPSGPSASGSHSAAANPATQEIIMHGYGPMEHPYVLKQAERVRELDAENRQLESIANSADAEARRQWIRAKKLDIGLKQMRVERDNFREAYNQLCEGQEEDEAEIKRLKAIISKHAGSKGHWDEQFTNGDNPYAFGPFPPESSAHVHGIDCSGAVCDTLGSDSFDGPGMSGSTADSHQINRKIRK